MSDDAPRETEDSTDGHGKLCDRYGHQVHTADVNTVMNLVGCTDTGMEKWAIGFRYDTAEAQGVLAAANWRDHGHLTLGPVTGSDGQLYDLLVPYRRDGVSAEEIMVRFRDQAHTADAAEVAAMLGRDDLSPDCCMAFRYDTREAFTMLAGANREAYGYAVHGPAEDSGGKPYGLVELGDTPSHAPWELDARYADGTPAEPEQGVWRCVESLYPVKRVPVAEAATDGA